MVGERTAMQKASIHLARAEALADDPQAKFHVRQAEQLLVARDTARDAPKNSDLRELSP